MTDEAQQHPEPPPHPTLDSIHATHLTAQKSLTFQRPGKTKNDPTTEEKVAVQPWHLAAIKAKHKTPGNKELTDEEYARLVEDVHFITIGGPPEAPKK